MTKIQVPMDGGSEQYEKSFTVLEPGDYEFVISNRPKLEQSKSSENMLVKLELEHTLEDGSTTKVFDNLVQTEKAYFKTFQCFRSCGFTEEDIKAGIELEDLYQLTCKAKVKQEIQTQGSAAGDPRNVIVRYLYEKE